MLQLWSVTLLNRSEVVFVFILSLLYELFVLLDSSHTVLLLSFSYALIVFTVFCEEDPKSKVLNVLFKSCYQRNIKYC